MSGDRRQEREMEKVDEQKMPEEAGAFEQMKKAYDDIEIPAELRQRVLESIEQGKTAKGEKIMRRILIRTGQTAAAALLAITVLANSGAGVAYAMERIPVIGAITRVVTFRTYEKQEGNTEAKIEVPAVEAESGSHIENAAEQVNRSAKEYTDQLIAQFEADVKANGSEAHEALYSGYEVLTDNDKLFTLRINTTQIMASGAESVKIYHIDKKTGSVLTLRDMFPEGTDYVKQLSEAARIQMEANMQADAGKSYFLNDGMDSDFTAIKADQNFYINDAGRMVLVFDEYEVAPGYMGVVEIELPQDVFVYH